MDEKTLQKRKKSLKISFPKIRNDRAVGDYMISKNEVSEMVRAYEWDKARQGPQMRLVEVRKDLERAENHLLRKKEYETSQRNALGNQWKELEEKEVQLRENFIRFSDFVKGNFEKRERASTRIQEDMGNRKKKIQQLKELQEKFDHMTEVRSLLHQNVMSFQIYEKYLQLVVDTSKQFKDVVDLVNRYEALMMAKNRLAERQQKELEELENARSNMMQLIEDNTFLILGLNNDMTLLHKRYTKTQTRSLFWENVVNVIRNRIFEKCEEINEVRTSAWNIYQYMCMRKEEKTEFDEDDFEKHLIYIKKTLSELRSVNMAVEAKEKQRKVGSNDAVKSTNQLFLG